ncbi:hypothetical protein JVT61DRAFT_7052 [Boletus reticuloceps]|uniref:Uncharacterized protein n=1 Tax=Boletus reticuloceps TaxID=495285 RepID=A0A8I2YKP9_9AGAM|nr:hypothetical protein JVT61DRAFT_7052 [Boletus reticuloceps]
MLIALQGKLMALERERLHDETQDFIRSHAFKGFIKRNPGIFKVPARALEDPELSDCIDTLIKDILTKQRSQIKFKIANSITKQHHISQLAKSLAQKDFIDVTRAQWARIAFLRQNMLFFNKLVTESMNKKLGVPDPEQGDGDSLDSNNNSEERLWSDSQFWEFIDTLLDELRLDFEQQLPEIRLKEWEKNFTEALQTDFDMFPPSDKASCLRASDGNGIADWQHAVHQELVWL